MKKETPLEFEDSPLYCLPLLTVSRANKEKGDLGKKCDAKQKYFSLQFKRFQFHH